MSNRFVISDTHFHHERVLTFLDKEGKRIRPFIDIDEHDELLIYNWNRMVSKRDTIWHLGDVFFGPEERFFKTFTRLNGNKKLIVGNHDHLTPSFAKLFNEIMLWKKDSKMDIIFSHMPLHDSVLNELSPTAINVHGHIHQHPSPSVRHVNVSVEQTNWAPVPFEKLKGMIPKWVMPKH